MRARFMATVGFALLSITAAGASAQGRTRINNVCKDATTTSATGRLACAGHGGVDAQATARLSRSVTHAERQVVKADVRADRTIAKAEERSIRDARDATARCNDGTYWHARTHQGACAGHRGVSRFLKG
jgi:hypothetical protein